MSETSAPAAKAAAALLRRFEILRLRGARERVDHASVATVIDRAADLPELLEEIERLHEIKRGAFAAVEELRESEERLREVAGLAERWIIEAVQSKSGALVEDLDLVRGRRLVSALARARGALRGARSRPRRTRDVPHQSPGS